MNLSPIRNVNVVAWALCVITGTALLAQEPPGPMNATLAVVGGYLIDGFGGPPKPNAVILINGDKIVAVGEEGRLAVPVGTKVIDANGYTVMPGLIDTHVHLDLIGHGNYDVWHSMVSGEYADVMQIAAAQLLRHGVTTARDAGGELRASVAMRDRVNRGDIPGPRLLVSGEMVGRWSEAEWARWYRRKVSINVNSVETARQAARRLLDGGADCIKIRTPLTLDETKAITGEAHARGKLVGQHLYVDDEIQTAVNGGVDIVDHAGSGHQTPLFKPETLRLLARTQVPIAQSISHSAWIYQELLAWPERLDDPELRQELGKYADAVLGSLKDISGLAYFRGASADLRIAQRASRQLYEGGGRIVVGTDAGSPGFFHSDAVAREMEAMIALAGMDPEQVIIAATRDAAAALKVNAGAIQPGRLADIILIRGNPLVDMRYIESVAHVIKGGSQYK